MPTCLNLRTTYGDKYRIEYEPSYHAEYGDNARVDDPWLQIIPCQHGHIGPFCSHRLFASTDRSGSIAKALRALPCVEVWQDGSDGLSVMFYPADAKQVFAVMKPRRKRQLSPEHLAKLTAASAAYRFQPASHGSKAPENDPETHATHLDGQSHQPVARTLF